METSLPDETPWLPTSKAALLPIGDRIRTRRIALDMTLQDLARASGLSAPFISQAERNLSVPSLTSLMALAKPLGVDIAYFMAVPENDRIVTRADQPRRVQVDSPVKYFDLTAVFEGRRLDSMLIHIPPGYAFPLDQHRGEHFRYVLQGELYATAGDVETVLGPGDSMHFDALLPHFVENRSENWVILLHVGSQEFVVRRKSTEPRKT